MSAAAMYPRESASHDGQDAVQLIAVIERKQATLPRYVVVPAAKLAAWQLEQTTVVDALLNGHSLGRRTLKRWDESRWFMELPDRNCRRLGIDVGDSVVLTIQLASSALPAELAQLLEADAAAQATWSSMSASQQRMLREEVLAAALPKTRLRRARCGLGLAAE